MKKNRFLLSLLFIISYSFSDNNRWTKSSFPGGYLSLGIQMGKTKDNSRFIDIQISPSFVLIGPYKHDFPGYLFLGSSIGKRFSKEKSIIYFDVNLNYWNTLITLGKGKGFIGMKVCQQDSDCKSVNGNPCKGQCKCITSDNLKPDCQCIRL